jgi:putative SOS response-associated peptidase YedK
MPVILPKEAWDTWLDPDVRDHAALAPLLNPWPAATMLGYAVSRLVNKPSNDQPECINGV